MIEDIFYELIEETAVGTVMIDDECWFIGFNSFIFDNGKLFRGNFNSNNISALTIKEKNF